MSTKAPLMASTGVGADGHTPIYGYINDTSALTHGYEIYRDASGNYYSQGNNGEGPGSTGNVYYGHDLPTWSATKPATTARADAVPNTPQPGEKPAQANLVGTPTAHPAAAQPSQSASAQSTAQPTATPAPTPAPAAPTAAPAPAATGYQGPSIVDFLKSTGQASDFTSRSAMAKQYGITNYTGTAAQNTQLLNTLRQSRGPVAEPPPVTTPAGTVGSAGTMGKATEPQGDAPVADKYAGLDPVEKQVQLYKDAYKSVGLSDIKDQYDTYTKQLGDIQNELNDKKQANQNNPWFSQSVVDRENSKLDTKYQSKMDTLSHLLTLTDSMYKQGLARVDTMVSDANADIKATNELAQKQIDAANALAKDNVVQSVGGRELLINKVTGKTVADLGEVTPSSSGTSLADKEALSAFNAALKTKGAGGTGSENSDALQGMLNYYQVTGKLPAFGLSANNPLRTQFYAALGGADGTTDINSGQTNLVVRAGMQRAYATQQNLYQANQTSIGTLEKQLNLAQTYSDAVGRTGSPLVNKYLLDLKKGVFGDPDTAALHNIVTTASYEFAKILSGAAASVAGVTVNSQQDAEDLLNSAMSKGQFNTVIGLMHKEANFRLSAQKDTLTQIQKDLQGIGTSNTSTSSGSSGTFNAAAAQSKYNY